MPLNKALQTACNLLQEQVALAAAIGPVVVNEKAELDHNQHARGSLFLGFKLSPQALIKGTPTGQAGHGIFVVHLAQMLDQLALPLKQLAEVIRHLIHGFGNLVQFPG